MKYLIWFFAIAVTFSFTACENGSGNDTENEDTDTLTTDRQMEEDTLAGEVSLNEFTDYYQDFSGVSLGLNADANSLSAGNQTITFDVQNFQLGEQTPDSQETGLANSGDGQHIHVIIDNQPYMAHYDPEVDVEISDDNRVMLAFPSRSYHLSLKDTYVLEKLNTTAGNDFDENAPHLFYSRPKGTYEGADTDQILLDFYLVNTDLSSDGNYIVATIDGNQEFKITEWKPYVLEGMSMGNHTIKLELFDADGNSVDSPLNPVTREITLKEGQGSKSM